MACQNDDTVITAETCDKPTNILLQNVTSTSIDISWDSSNTGVQFEIEYGNSGFTQGNGTVISNITSPYTLSSLTESTSYDFYIRTNCTSLDSEWTDVTKFNTLCNGGAYTGDVTLITQQEVNNFATNCYNVINGTLFIGGNSGNSNITNLEGLETITSIDGSLFIGENPGLTTLSGLENLNFVGNNIEIGNDGGPALYPNPNLSDFCALTNLFISGTYRSVWFVGNAYNPTVQNMIDGNCSN